MGRDATLAAWKKMKKNEEIYKKVQLQLFIKSMLGQLTRGATWPSEAGYSTITRHSINFIDANPSIMTRVWDNAFVEG